MSKDSLRPLFVAAGIVAVAGAVFFGGKVRQAFRPVLVEVRVVTATAADPVFRDGVRHLAPGEAFQAAVALRLTQRGKGSFWVSPVDRIELGGEPLPHRVVPGWPESDRSARVLWMTVESASLGGELTPGDEQDLLRYRTFLAPEMGRDLIAAREPEPHNDDFLAPEDQPRAGGPGTLRLAARVEVVAEPSDITPLQAVTSSSDPSLGAPGTAAISRAWSVPEGLHTEAGELFLLPGFQPPPGDDGTAAARLVALARSRLAASATTFIGTALLGDPALDPSTLPAVTHLRLKDGRLLAGRRELSWGHGVQPGDVLDAEGHPYLLITDDGDGVLDLDDTAAHCWGRPPVSGSLGNLLEAGPVRLVLRRHGG